MHELTLAENIHKIIQQNLPDPQVTVSKIHIKIGKLSGVVPDSLKFCFQIVAQDTQAAQAILDIEEVPVKAYCPNCQVNFTIDAPCFLCPNCSSEKIRLISGQELLVESFEVEE